MLVDTAVGRRPVALQPITGAASLHHHQGQQRQAGLRAIGSQGQILPDARSPLALAGRSKLIQPRNCGGHMTMNLHIAGRCDNVGQTGTLLKIARRPAALHQYHALFARQAQRIAPLLEQPSTGKRCAFFSITSSGLATVRKSGDYVAQMIGMAGGEYVFTALTDSGNSLSTMNLPQETFYAQARNADVLIYNSTIEGVVDTREQLVKKCAMLADFKAVQSGDCWCTSKSFFQQSMALPDLIVDMNRVFTEGDPAPEELTLLQKIS